MEKEHRVPKPMQRSKFKRRKEEGGAEEMEDGKGKKEDGGATREGKKREEGERGRR